MYNCRQQNIVAGLGNCKRFFKCKPIKNDHELSLPGK
jgi:hypothetical protein